MSKTPHQRFDCAAGCPVEAALAVIGGKWKGTILYHLFAAEVLRFNEIRRILPEVSQRTLTAQLRALEKDGIISRTVYPEVPPKVEYRLTDYGTSLREAVTALKTWGETHKNRAVRNTACALVYNCFFNRFLIIRKDSMWYIVAIGYLFVTVIFAAAQPGLARALIYLVFWSVLPTLFVFWVAAVRRRNKRMKAEENKKAAGAEKPFSDGR